MKSTIKDRVNRKVRRESKMVREIFSTIDIAAIEKRLLAGVLSGDIHAAVAADILGIPVSQVTREQRRIGKAANFYLLYGNFVEPGTVRPPRRMTVTGRIYGQHGSND